MNDSDPPNGTAEAQALLQHRPPAIVILNQAAGSNAASLEVRDRIASALASAGSAARLVEVGPGQSLREIVERVADEAAASGATVVAAGGDGTISTVASACFLHGVALGVVPLGTFNFFAREFGLPEDPADAMRVALTGKPVRVDVGFVNARMFLNNASFGIYPRLIRERESTKARLGRRRWVAALAAFITLLRGQRRFAVSLQADDVRHMRRTTMVFVGNNALQLEQLGLEVSGCVAQGRLAVIVQRRGGRLSVLRQMLLGALGRLRDEVDLERFCSDNLIVDSKRRTIELAIDGELCSLTPPLVFSKAQRALTLIMPADARQQ
jgi:diacylglycerol kinase family enzyme